MVMVQNIYGIEITDGHLMPGQIISMT